MRFSVVTTLALALLLSVAASPAARAAPGDIPAGYPEAERGVVQEGRAVTGLLRAGDAEALHARFAPALAEEVPLEVLREQLAEVLAVAAVGERIAESALPLGPGERTYGADLRWGDRRLGLDLVFDNRDRIASVRFAPRKPLPRDPANGREVRVRLPLAGNWWVFWGGKDELRNYHVVAADQRHAIDFVRWQRGATARGSGARNRDYHAWGRQVLAPGGGVVVTAQDRVRDNRPRVQTENPRHPAGNHVIIALGDRRFALLGHLRRGSVRVRRGDRVRAGDLLGRVGNSGNSSEPHLHFHVQDRPRLSRGTGLPVRFAGVVVDGRPRQAAAALQGSFIAPGR